MWQPTFSGRCIRKRGLSECKIVCRVVYRALSLVMKPASPLFFVSCTDADNLKSICDSPPIYVLKGWHTEMPLFDMSQWIRGYSLAGVGFGYLFSNSRYFFYVWELFGILFVYKCRIGNSKFWDQGVKEKLWSVKWIVK